MPENKFVLISLLKYSHMHSSTILSAGVAAALKTTSLGPIVDFIQSINDQSTKIALTQIAKDHEERLKMLEGTSGINLQILEKIKALFQGKGGVEELKEVVDFQRNGEHACLLLPGLLLDDDIRSKFLVNLSHAGDGAKIIEVGNKPALEIGRPDLLHFLIKDTREKILLCQTPVGFVNLALEWQKERTRKQRGNHELGIEPFEKFDFVYDKDGVPKAKLNTQTSSYTVPKVKAKTPERSKEDIQNRIKNMRRTVISLVLLALSGLSVYGIKKCEQDRSEYVESMKDWNIRLRMGAVIVQKLKNNVESLKSLPENTDKTNKNAPLDLSIIWSDVDSLTSYLDLNKINKIPFDVFNHDIGVLHDGELDPKDSDVSDLTQRKLREFKKFLEDLETQQQVIKDSSNKSELEKVKTSGIVFIGNIIRLVNDIYQWKKDGSATHDMVMFQIGFVMAKAKVLVFDLNILADKLEEEFVNKK